MRKTNDKNKHDFIMERGTAFHAICFGLPLVILLAVYVINGVYPFGNRTTLVADLYHQYMPFLTEYKRNLWTGGMDFSMNVGIGSDFYALFVYYLASPFHLCAAFVPQEYLTEFIAGLVALKTGLCGLCFSFWFQGHYKFNDQGQESSRTGTADGEACCTIGIMGACFYALSGFMMAYNYNIMWLDCVVILPVIVLGLEKLVVERKPALYCISLAYSIFTNFYLSIMICLFLVLYYGYLCVMEKGLKQVVIFGWYSLLAGAMAGVLLVPEVSTLLATDFGKMEFPTKIVSYFSVLDELARHCMCTSVERGLEHWPNIYCGCMVLVLVPLYLMNERISLRDKFCKLGLITFFLLSFSTNVLDFVWHGMNYPDSLPARQSFLYLFVVLLLCCDCLMNMEGIRSRQIMAAYLTAVGLLLFWQKFLEDGKLEQGTLLATLVFITMETVCLHFYQKKQELHRRRSILIIALVMVIAECGINTWDTGIGTTDRTKYTKHMSDYKALYQQAQDGSDGFFRLELFDRRTKNDGTLYGFPSATLFSSTMDSRVMQLYKRLGMRHSKVYYSYDGATAFTQGLLNVSYMLGSDASYENDMYSRVTSSGEITLFACGDTLPFGYVAPSGYDVPEDAGNSLLLQNDMVRALGVEGELFTLQSAQRDGEDVVFQPETGGFYYARMTSGGTAKADCIGGAVPQMSYKDLKKNSILYLGYLEKGQRITLTNADAKDETPQINAELYRMDREVLQEAFGTLNREHLEEVTVARNQISGKLTLEKAGRLILSVPTGKGWRVWVNDVETIPSDFGGCLTALDLEPGEYRIFMKYTPWGLLPGGLLSAGGILLLAGSLWYNGRKKQWMKTKEKK